MVLRFFVGVLRIFVVGLDVGLSFLEEEESIPVLILGIYFAVLFLPGLIVRPVVLLGGERAEGSRG
jgi:hypothetical protein